MGVLINVIIVVYQQNHVNKKGRRTTWSTFKHRSIPHKRYPKIMKIVNHLRNARTGWIAGLLFTAGFAWLWQRMFPVIDRTGQGAAIPVILFLILAIVSPLAIAGGVIGGRLPKEGGTIQQILYAVLFGVLFPIPFSCFLFWYTGW